MFLSEDHTSTVLRAASTCCLFHIWINSGANIFLKWIVSTATMSTSVLVEPVMEKSYAGVGRCKCSFWFAVAHDILGVLIMMVGVFGGLIIHDLFIYAGAIIIFLSLIWWVFWYSGNIDVPPEELEDDVGKMKLKNRRLSRVVRRVSSRLSSRIRDSLRRGDRNNSNPINVGTEMGLSTIYNTTIQSPSREITRDTLSV